ncbi:sulfur carrier protein ThiS [Vineibacter terrae]|uniref:Sulfur carrier protein ThiS n=1 Tax=Vineibacter terrae TaxID=2586908 RepID=A0A5C8PCT7_9HYPH|nr:sulfur carrier protein ThiS [Vineibacter terrae]TXL71316.1 sulfur carrier protein ThiS [Vineibacter terrae]
MDGSEIRVNGKNEALASATVSELLADKGLEAEGRGVAVAVNGRIVPRVQWPQTRLVAGDAVEIVRAMKGG